MLIDSHIHLQDIQDQGVRADLLSRAAEVQVGKLMCNGIRPEDWSLVDEISRGNDRVVPFFGVHPWYADKVGPGWDVELERLLQREEAGIGEIGLDKVRKEVSYARQTEVFHRQIQIAGRLSKPMAIHCVRAWGDLLNILRSNLTPGSRFMMHSFHGSPEMLRNFLELGAYISFSWKILCHGTEEIMNLIRQVPMDRLLLETDFPYTEPHRMGTDITAGKYFECLRGVYSLAARAKEIEEGELEKKVWENGAAFLHRTSEHPKGLSAQQTAE